MSYGADEHHNSHETETMLANERDETREHIKAQLVAGISKLYADLQAEHCFRFDGRDNVAMKLEVILDAARDVCGDMRV